MMALENAQADDDFNLVEFRKIVEDLTTALGDDLDACDLKWSLFVAAARSYRFDSQLKPFPPAYQQGTTVNIAELLSVVEQTPSFALLHRLLLDNKEHILRKYYNSLRLLHWNLVTIADPRLKSVEKEKVSFTFTHGHYKLSLLMIEFM